MNEKLFTQQDGKNVSLCFMNNDTFKKLTENRTESEMVELAQLIYESALSVLSNSEKTYATLNRQLKMMDKDSLLYEMALRRKESVNNTIENLNSAINAMETGSSEFHWVKYMIERCLGAGQEEE